ncbi:tenascin-N [Sceloporus undulatus]|uniref:tenascin-N n=1 Tax=Sceloporus undulatus TaxID=8520 RepID=UPI001C4C223D|nr:tenascin-N [Sceloporus undulatus]XP_042321944.1 tenascin-N [Sceloporus undulatus]XP_042321945.1 tenascin-N [Sceloporus undulatus]XP_042321946.1 tenascin-N [Sceloporus undulatus]
MVTLNFLLWILLHHSLPEALAQLAAPPENCFGKNQKISFSHSYKIDVPKSTQIKVEPDPRPLQDDSHILLATGEMDEEQNIIFRHNIQLQTPKGDCEVIGQLKSLLERMEKMEMEVVRLKGLCSPQRCCGRGQGVSSCSGHGSFSQETCGCNCDEGWEGPDCSRPTCPGNCNGNGRCIGGRCICHARYSGEDCSQLLCPENCSGNGVCVNGVCHCYREFIGDDCSEKRCPNDCSGHGYCDSGECYCEDGFTGLDCSKVIAPWNARLLKTTEDSLAIGWDKMMEVDYYIITYFPIGSETSVKEVQVPKDQVSYEILGLLPGTKYVIALRNVKKGVSSDPELLQASTAVSAVGVIWVTDETENSLEVEWENPATEVDYYKLRVSSLLGEEKEVVVPKSNDAKSRYVITGLKPGTQYKITVISVKGEVEGKPSTVNGWTEIDGPTNLKTSHVTEDTATISWNGAQAPIDRYIVSYTSADGDTKEMSVGKDKRTTTLMGLKPGTQYTIYIWAMKGTQQSRKASTEAETEIDGPTNLKTDQATENTATISWNKALAPIDRYIVSYISADGENREIAVGKDKTSTTLTGLKPGMEYIISIWAVKGSLQSKRASTKTVTEIDPPRNVRVSEVTQSSGVVTWTAPDAEISGYLLTYREPDGTTREIQLSPNDQMFVLENLSRGTKYTIYIMAFKGDRWSKKAATTFTTVSLRYPYPADCSQLQQNGHSTNGMYTIYLNGDANRPLEVFCDMITDGGGWIVFQRRNSGQLDFYKRWRNYVEGFGDPSGEFWLGLEKLHELTTSAPYEMRVDLRTHNESAYAVYDLFQVGTSRERYRLSVGKYRGTAGDAMTYHHGYKFTTWDRDNDIAISNCAMTHHGGWWYKNCHLANPNGKYGDDKHSEGVNWEPWKGHLYSIPFTEMKIRPRSHSFGPIFGRKRRSLVEKRKEAGI